MRLYKTSVLTTLSLALMAQGYCLAAEPSKQSTEVKQSDSREAQAPWEKLMDSAMASHDKNQFNAALSQAKEALKLLQADGKRNRDLTFVMETVGLYTYEMGNYKEADEIIERAMEINIALSGRKSREVVNNLNMLGRIKRHQDNLADAKKLTQEAIEIAAQLKDGGTPDEATLTHNLGRIYQAESDFEHAKECYLKAIELTEKAGKTNTDAYITYKQNLGTLYLKNGNLDQAKELMDSSLKLKESLGHATDKNTAFIKGNLAQVAIQQGDTEKARELYKGAIGILAKGVDPNKQHLAKFMEAYGELLADLNETQTKKPATVSKAITDSAPGVDATYEQIKSEPYLPPLNFKPTIIKILAKENPENLLSDFQDDPIEAAKQMKNAPLFVFALLKLNFKHLESGTRPIYISPSDWDTAVKLWKEDQAAGKNSMESKALIYTIHPELGMGEVDRILQRQALRRQVNEAFAKPSNTTSSTSTAAHKLIPDVVLNSMIERSNEGQQINKIDQVSMTTPKSWTTVVDDKSANGSKRISTNALAGVVSCTLTIDTFESNQNVNNYTNSFKIGMAKGLGIAPSEITILKDVEDKLGSHKCRRVTMQFKTLGHPATVQLLIFSQVNKVYSLAIAIPDEIKPRVQPILDKIEKSVDIKI